MGASQIKGDQIKDGTIGVADLSATGSPSSLTYYRGDNTWALIVEPDLPLNLNAPSVSETITAGWSSFVNRFYKVASGTKLTIGSGAYFRIL